MIRLTALLMAFAFTTMFSSCAPADIIQQIFFEFDPTPFPGPSGDEDTDADRIEGQTDADINRALIAGIAGNGYSASGSMGVFGSYGLMGSQFTRGEVHSQVFIEVDATAPPGGAPRPAVANFIIDGGMFNFTAGPASTLEYTLSLLVDSSIVFQTFGEITGDPTFGNPAFLTGGTDIGALQSPLNPSNIDIPFSFQSVDLGVLNPGQSFLFQYQLDIISTVGDATEGIVSSFRIR